MRARSDSWLQRRARINRILMRKRNHEGPYKEMAPATYRGFWSIVLHSSLSVFLSSGAGVAYAYYQSQIPLLDNIAQHSLFQTTHIYDRQRKTAL